MYVFSPTAAILLGALCHVGELVAATETQKPLGGGRAGPFTKDFGKHVDELLETWHVPGVAIGVVDGDDTWTEV